LKYVNIYIKTGGDLYSQYGFQHFIGKYQILLPNIAVFKKPELNDHISKMENNENYQNKLLKLEDIFRTIGLILSGSFEKSENSNLLEKEKTRLGIPNTPAVDYLEKQIFNSILNTCKKLKSPLVLKSFWPYGKKFAVCLTHDVDEVRKTYQYITRSLRCIKNRDLNCLKNQFMTLLQKIKGKEPYWTFEDIISMERKLGVRSTFFFLNENAKVNIFDPSTWRHYGRKFNIKDPKVVNLIRSLHSGGWEVGLHGSFYSYKDAEKLKREKEILEEVLGDKIHGTRQHNLNLSIPETWKYHEEIGLEYDTTLGFNDRIGFRWGTSFPFCPLDKEGRRVMKLLEIPLIIEDIALFSYNDPWREFIKIVNEVERCGGVLTLLWHHSVFNCVEFPGWAEMYKKIVEYCKNRGAWIANGYDIARWWKMREESRLDVEYRDDRLIIIPANKTHDYFIDIYTPNGRKAKVSSNAEVIRANKDLLTISIRNLQENEKVIIEFL